MSRRQLTQHSTETFTLPWHAKCLLLSSNGWEGGAGGEEKCKGKTQEDFKEFTRAVVLHWQ